MVLTFQEKLTKIKRMVLVLSVPNQAAQLIIIYPLQVARTVLVMTMFSSAMMYKKEKIAALLSKQPYATLSV